KEYCGFGLPNVEISGDQPERRAYRNVQFGCDLRQLHTAGQAHPLFEELSGNLIDDLIDIAGVVQSDCAEYGKGSLNILARFITGLLFYAAALLGEEFRPVLIQDQQVRG